MDDTTGPINKHLPPQPLKWRDDKIKSLEPSMSSPLGADVELHKTYPLAPP